MIEVAVAALEATLAAEPMAAAAGAPDETPIGAELLGAAS